MASEVDMANAGHGHVFPRPDGVRARCGGPGMCVVCSADLARKQRGQQPTEVPSNLRNPCQFDPLVFGTIQAGFHRESLGGDPVLTITEPHRESEVCLDMKEARALRDWLDGVLQVETGCAGLVATAPQDGTPILGWNADYGWRETKSVTFQPGSPGHAEGRTDRWWTWDEPKNNWAFHWNPTHWLPLPQHPKTSAPLTSDPARIDTEQFPEGSL